MCLFNHIMLHYVHLLVFDCVCLLSDAGRVVCNGFIRFIIFLETAACCCWKRGWCKAKKPSASYSELKRSIGVRGTVELEIILCGFVGKSGPFWNNDHFIVIVILIIAALSMSLFLNIPINLHNFSWKCENTKHTHTHAQCKLVLCHCWQTNTPTSVTTPWTPFYWLK